MVFHAAHSVAPRGGIASPARLSDFDVRSYTAPDQGDTNVEAVVEYNPVKRHPKPGLRSAMSRHSIIDNQLFRFGLDTILQAHLFGHVTEATALRLIARNIRECLI